MRLRFTHRARRSGVAAVELAFLLPLVLIPLLFGMWEVGRLIECQQVVSNAAREGARAASTGQFTDSQVQTIITNYLQHQRCLVCHLSTRCPRDESR
jgi:Flp pilus assembly protein TadG